MMPIHTIMSAVKKQLEGDTGRPIFVGPPDASQPGVYLHPYAVDETREFPSHADSLPGIRVRVFLSVQPEEDYELLGMAMGSLREHAVIKSGEMSVAVTLSSLGPSELALLFLAMGIAYRMAVPYEMQITAPSKSQPFGKKIAAADADGLIGDAQDIIEALEADE